MTDGLKLLLTGLDATDDPAHGPAPSVLRYIKRFERVLNEYGLPQPAFTIACSIGKHKLCSGQGVLDDGETPFECDCLCHD